MSQTVPAPCIERIPAVLSRTRLSRSSLYALIARGEFLRPLKLSARPVAFLSDEINAWIAERAAARTAL